MPDVRTTWRPASEHAWSPNNIYTTTAPVAPCIENGPGSGETGVRQPDREHRGVAGCPPSPLDSLLVHRLAGDVAAAGVERHFLASANELDDLEVDEPGERLLDGVDLVAEKRGDFER